MGEERESRRWGEKVGGGRGSERGERGGMSVCVCVREIE